MFYEALVIDNSKYFETGTIQIRVSHFFQFRMNWDLSTNTADVEYGKEKDSVSGKEYHHDFDAYLFAPLGGGDGYGTLILPQINERGFVFFPEDDFYYNPVWIGSYFRPFFDKDGNFVKTNIPSNLTDKDAIDSNNASEINYNTDQKTNILIRTKNTEFDKNDADKMKWVSRPTTNIISVSNEGVKARHYNQQDGWKDNKENQFTDVNITDNEITLSSNSIEKGKKFSIVLKDETLEVNKDDTTKFIIDKEGNITVDTPKKVFFNNADKIEFLGNSRHLIGYEELYDALDTYVCNHIHITPNGPSEGPLDSSMAPLRSMMINDMIQMKENNLLTE